jgi:hypothetical protein
LSYRQAELDSLSSSVVLQSSKCIVWTPCGITKHGIKVGDPVTKSDIVGGADVTIFMPDTDCEFEEGVKTPCTSYIGNTLELFVPYFFTVLHTSEEYVTGKELYAGVITSWTYERIVYDEELYVRMIASVSNMLMFVGVTVVCMRCLHRNSQRKLEAVFFEAFEAHSRLFIAVGTGGHADAES